MKKGVLRMLALACVLALGLACATMLTACGDDDKTAPGEKFTYSEVQVDGEDNDEMVDVYNMMYANSTLEVTDSKVIWALKDQKTEMSYTKDGDKLMLAGAYIESMKETIQQISPDEEIGISLYGVRTETGFKIVMQITFDVNDTQEIRILFTKA